MARSLNRVSLIGNLTRDPELRYTPQGTAVCTFGMATNRQWTTETGEKKEDTEFHRIVSWNKLAELCAQLLSKGRKVFVQGRLQTRTWTGQDEVRRTTTEIVISDMIILDSRRTAPATQVPPDDFDVPEEEVEKASKESVKKGEKTKTKTKSKDSGTKKSKSSPKKKSSKQNPSEEEDMPF